MALYIRHKGVRRFFETGSTLGIHPHDTSKLRIQLAVLNVASSIKSLRAPEWGLQRHNINDSRHWAIINQNGRRLIVRVDGGRNIITHYEQC
ncbi:hypothetical protein R84981_000621 [Carnimonas sp. R-84981]|uniref:type II toxin-antitoxin system RelE/ParE family toxin n=1 Tax=Carnimonas bestiolae TaxID=3402172 RepID=UPI003EDBE45F